jgi:hypothetical protein
MEFAAAAASRPTTTYQTGFCEIMEKGRILILKSFDRFNNTWILESLINRRDQVLQQQ